MRTGSGARGNGVGRNFAISKSDLRGIKKLGYGDAIGGGSTCYTPDPWIEINKNSQETSNHKKIGMAFFVGNFRDWARTSKIRLENKEGAPIS